MGKRTFMRVISIGTLRQFWALLNQYDAEQPLRSWFDEVKNAQWKTPADIRASYRNANFIVNNRVEFHSHNLGLSPKDVFKDTHSILLIIYLDKYMPLSSRHDSLRLGAVFFMILDGKGSYYFYPLPSHFKLRALEPRISSGSSTANVSNHQPYGVLITSIIKWVSPPNILSLITTSVSYVAVSNNCVCSVTFLAKSGLSFLDTDRDMGIFAFIGLTGRPWTCSSK
ncbi:MAG: hypothetical protein ACI9NY_001153 [Kiritimatiellia bacterium]|jgi:hypothetical protein